MLSNASPDSSIPFQFKLFSLLSQQNKGENVLISPLSIFVILSLTANGANGQTKDEFLKGLSYETIEKVNEIIKKIHGSYSKFTAVEVANAVMTKIEPLKSFEEIAGEYKAKCEKLESLEQVNKWCNDKTHGKISKILDQLTSDIMMILLNAVYFKGNWLTEFKANETIVRDFFSTKHGKQSVKMMKIKGLFNYYEDNNLQAIELPYKEDNAAALVVLPKGEINSFVVSFSVIFQTVYKSLKQEKVALKLPKFRQESDFELKKYLEVLGIKSAFDGQRADFGKITKEMPLYISKVVHKAFLNVDEKGTEAAAVTAVVMNRMMCRPEKYIEMNVNKPFIFVILSKDLMIEHNILFLSKVENI